MSQLETIARPYAKAAYELASEKGNIAQWAQFLAVAASICCDESVARRLNAPNFLTDLQTWIDEYLQHSRGQGLRGEEKNFLQVLEEANRLNVLPQIESEFQQFVAKADNLCKATVYTARALSKPQQQKIADALAKKTGQKVSLEVIEKPELLAGVRIEYNGLVLDQSAQGRLADFARQLEESRN